MKTSAIFYVKLTTAGLITGLLNIAAYAQKLPTEQQSSIRAPANIKIDGKTTEWDNQFQAYNKHTDFYYTMANDDNNLYVIIQATDPAIIRRIMNGGITLTVNPSEKKDNKTGANVTYPVFDKNNRFILALFASGRRFSLPINGSTIDIRGYNSASNNVFDTKPINGPPANNDSLALVNNTNLNNKAKYIRVSGIKNVDTLISVYNQDGIKASALFNSNMAYTYELAIALKHLDISVSNPVRFAYQLKINEVASQGITYTKDSSGKITGFSFSKEGSIMEQPATDFWSEYTLTR